LSACFVFSSTVWLIGQRGTRRAELVVPVFPLTPPARAAYLR